MPIDLTGFGWVRTTARLITIKSVIKDQRFITLVIKVADLPEGKYCLAIFSIIYACPWKRQWPAEE